MAETARISQCDGVTDRIACVFAFASGRSPPPSLRDGPPPPQAGEDVKRRLHRTSSPACGGGGPRQRWRGRRAMALEVSVAADSKVRLRPKEVKSRALAKNLRRSMTHAEVLLWQCLRRDAVEGMRFRRQHPIGPYIADFACLPVKLVVEVDGATHGSDAQVAHDRRRSAYLARLGWRVVRFSNWAVYDDMASVIEAIWLEVKKAPSTTASRRSPTPARGGG